MNLIVVYKGYGKIAADQLKKLVSQKDDSEDEIIGTEDNTIDVVAMEEKSFIDNSKTMPFKDPILFIDDVKGGSDIKPIAKPRKYGYGVICGFAGPQAVLTVNIKALRKKKEYNKFLEKLNSMTFQQISTAPREWDAFWDSLMHGMIGTKERREKIKKQQLIYGVTMLYNNDLQEFMKSYGK